MSGHAQSSSDHDVDHQQGPPHRYRIKRRNASVGDNINVFNKHLQESTYRGKFIKRFGAFETLRRRLCSK